MSINSYLENIAKMAIIQENERERINRSIQVITQRLKSYFHFTQVIIDEPLVFGSYKRKTIIPRNLDPNSDVDIMVIFGMKFEHYICGLPQYKPHTYLGYLKSFANAYYERSEIYQDFPSVVIELNHIKFDLVPATYDYSGDYKIPEKPIEGYYYLQDWTDTNPDDLDRALVNNQTLRRLVRLAKIWNVKSGYIFTSYELEKWITQQFFWGNLEEHFFRFCELLPISWDFSKTKKDKIMRLKNSERYARTSQKWEYLSNLFK